MADNVELSAGSGGAIIAADDIGPGVWYQRVKINHGADGSATDVSAASPLPVIGGSNSGVDIGDVTVNNGVGAAAVPIQDGGNSITVDGAVTVSGTVTADLGATDNAVLDDIAAKLGTIDTDTSALAGAISGTEVQVDVVGSLPAGTNAIGKLAANSGVDIGDVDVTSVVPGTGATALGKAVDDAAGGTDTGIAMLAVRADTPATLTPVDGDYVRLRVSSKGHLWVRELNPWDDAIFVDVSLSMTAGSPATLYTPTSGKKFRLLAFMLSQSGSGVNIVLRYGATPTTFMRIPTQSASISRDIVPLQMLGPRGIAPGAVNDALKLDVSTGSGIAVTGSIWVLEE